MRGQCVLFALWGAGEAHAVAMATCAGDGHHRRMVHVGRSPGRKRFMTAIARHLAARYVCLRHTNGLRIHADMAIAASDGCDRRVIKPLLLPVRDRGVTGIALGGGTGRDVITGFAYASADGGQKRAVMASKAGRGSHDCMVHAGRFETGIVFMTTLTRRIGRHVVARLEHRSYTIKALAVVAARTAAENARVVECHVALPAYRLVAVIT